MKGFCCRISVLLKVLPALTIALGLAVVVLGIWVEAKRYNYAPVGTFPGWPDALVIAAGSLMIVTGVVGIVCAARDYSGGTKLFTGCLLFAILLEAIFGTLGLIYSARAGQIWSGQLNRDIVQKYSLPGYSQLSRTVDDMQAQTRGESADQENLDEPDDGCTYYRVNEPPPGIHWGYNLRDTGCEAALRRWIERKINLLAILSLSNLLLQVATGTALYWQRTVSKVEKNLYRLDD